MKYSIYFFSFLTVSLPFDLYIFINIVKTTGVQSKILAAQTSINGAHLTFGDLWKLNIFKIIEAQT